jgi:hypothetical protein
MTAPQQVDAVVGTTTPPGFRMFSVGPEPLEAENAYYRLLDELEARLPGDGLPERIAAAVINLVEEARDEMACEFEMALDRLAATPRAVLARRARHTHLRQSEHR